MGALQVMQEVGKQWQAMTEEERKYFKDKADKDKVRYLNEQRAFYDEVERIGCERGTVKTGEGQIVVAQTLSVQQEPSKQQKIKIQKAQSYPGISFMQAGMPNET